MTYRRHHLSLISVALVCATAMPSLAAVRPCSTALVTAGLCANASDVLVSFSLPTTDPDGAGPRVAVRDQVVEGCALTFGYSPFVAGAPNPETKAQFCDRVIRTEIFRAWATRYYDSLAEAGKQAAIAATPADAVP